MYFATLNLYFGSPVRFLDRGAHPSLHGSMRGDTGSVRGDTVACVVILHGSVRGDTER